MVKKLIKYDFSSYFRILFPVQIIMLATAGANRIMQIFEKYPSISYQLTYYSSAVIFYVSIAALSVMSLVIAVVRFYQGMYTNEGYLSHTLPVTPAQHITAKLLTSLMFYCGSAATIIASMLIKNLGEKDRWFFERLGWYMRELYAVLQYNLTLYIIEGVLLIFALMIARTLKFYFCISVGQLVSKKRLLLAFGVYFGLYVLSQVFGTVVLIIMAIDPNWLTELMNWLTGHMKETMHIYLCGSLVLQIILSAVYFLITRLIMTKKLNLT